MTSLDDLPIRADLRGEKPYGAPQLDVPYALNTNENPYPPSERLVKALGAAVMDVAGSLNRYPDRDAVALRGDLAAFLNRESLDGAPPGAALTARQVWAANGSNEIIQQILQAFGGSGRSALGFEPSYSMHQAITRVSGTRWIDAHRAEDFGLEPERAVAAIKEHRPDVVFLTSPNNPTGTALPLEAIEAALDAAPGMVVVDEAYGEFRRAGTPSALSLLPGRPRLIVTRTMSKAFAMAGTRLGYLAADPAVLDALLLVRLPYHLSSVTQAVARTAVAFGDELLGTVGALRRERDDLVAWLRAEGLTVADSDANFVLFGTFPDRRRVWEALLERGVLIREVGPPEWLRVSVGTPDEMAAFRTALKESL
ncbi:MULTISPECIES: histidinol-phosphate transaminase [Thermomonosporaceae]|uniref:histidinol-phosphate transaminase n=1 Tax=Thermomonosporaceae TaxID=2012 RepID=UPI00255ABD74|nr:MULTISPECIES: histidinol-phosphate transaminase [Thermomonosporaceae]MDL4770983.1 histidinol-phosphate transaminase [Actinomadura xylanilytica]